jgi:hypothetical protein
VRSVLRQAVRAGAPTRRGPRWERPLCACGSRKSSRQYEDDRAECEEVISEEAKSFHTLCFGEIYERGHPQAGGDWWGILCSPGCSRALARTRVSRAKCGYVERSAPGRNRDFPHRLPGGMMPRSSSTGSRRSCRPTTRRSRQEPRARPRGPSPLMYRPLAVASQGGATTFTDRRPGARGMSC